MEKTSPILYGIEFTTASIFGAGAALALQGPALAGAAMGATAYAITLVANKALTCLPKADAVDGLMKKTHNLTSTLILASSLAHSITKISQVVARALSWQVGMLPALGVCGISFLVSQLISRGFS